MENDKRKSLDELTDESETFELRLDETATADRDQQRRSALIAEITGWLRDCVEQGRYIPPASADRRALRSLLDRWRSRLRDYGVYDERIGTLAEFDAAAGFVLTGGCPYPGLEPYTESERRSFFGRESVVESCVKHLDQPGNRILLIIGASGSGKSSLAMAGVLPALANLHAGAWYFAPRFTPGAHPIGELATALASTVGQGNHTQEVARQLAANPDNALEQLARWCANKPLMLFIDQFEELLTMVRDPGEQRAFAQALSSITRPDAPSGFTCRVLLTLRTDHLARFESNSGLRDLYVRLVSHDNQRYLSPIAFEDIKRAIKGPADEVGLRFIPATLIDQLASQTAGLSNGLPLLQYGLRRLWDTRPRNTTGQPLDLITDDMVKRLPDVEGALGTVADTIFRTFSLSQQQACERLLLELVVLDDSFEEPLRRRRVEAELRRVLEARFPDADDVATVIDRFVAAGLLRRFGEPPNSRLEVAHEALLRHWSHIYRLLTGADAKERLHLVKQIGREAADWAGHGKMTDYLNLRGDRLARATSYAADGWLAEAEAAAYVESCREREEELQARERSAREEKERADHARALAMAAEAELELNSQRSLLLTIEAAKTLEGGWLPEVESALRSAVRASRVTGSFKTYGAAGFSAAAFTTDGSTLAVGDTFGGITLWDVKTGIQRQALFAHLDEVKSISFSPDGRTMASGGDDGRVVIWHIDTAEPSRVLAGHVDSVTSVGFSRPTGRILATASADGSVRLWDVASGMQIGDALYGHSSGVKALALGRDERQLVTAGDDNRVVAWDALQGIILYSWGVDSSLFDIDLSSDGSLLAVATTSGVDIWDTATRSRQWKLTGHSNSVFCVRFSADHRHVATASYDSTIRIWRLPRASQNVPVETLTQIRPEPSSDPRDSFITALAFDATADTVAAAFLGGTATIWNIAGGGELLTLPAYEAPINAVAFSPDGTIAAAGERDGPVLTWDIAGRRRHHPFEDEGSASTVAFGPGGLFAVGSGHDVLVARPGAVELRLIGHTNRVSDLAFSPDGSCLVSVSLDASAIVWAMPHGIHLRTLIGHSEQLIAVAFSHDGRILATGGKDKRIVLWRAGTWEQVRALDGHYVTVLDLAFDAAGGRLVSGSKDKTVRVWNVETGEQLAVVGAHTDVVYAVAIHGDFLAAAADDGIRLWNLKTLAPIPVFPTRSHGARSLAFSSDGRYLAAGAADGVVRVYAMERKELLDLANRGVHRGWTKEESQWFLHSDSPPRTQHSTLDAACQSLSNFEFATGERLLREARGGSTADSDAIEAEARVRISTFAVWAAGKVIGWTSAEDPSQEEPRKLALGALLLAKDKIANQWFDPAARLRDLLIHRHVKGGQRLARKGKLAESIEMLAAAREQGWSMATDPRDAAAQLFALEVLSDSRRALTVGTVDEVRSRAAAVEEALSGFPQIRSGYRIAAALCERLDDFARVEKHYLAEADARERSAEPLALLALRAVSKTGPGDMLEYAQKALAYGRQALDRDPSSDEAWFAVGLAQHCLKDEKSAAEAFDQVSLSSGSFATAMNNAGNIYFDGLDDDKAAYQRFTRAVQSAPHDVAVLSNYAEFLLASGRNHQARLAALRARSHPDAQAVEYAAMRAAMSFVVFSADVLLMDRDGAMADLEEIQRHVAAAAQQQRDAIAAGNTAAGWIYHGIRRALEQRLNDSTWHRGTILEALSFVEANGQVDTLDNVRRTLTSQAASV